MKYLLKYKLHNDEPAEYEEFDTSKGLMNRLFQLADVRLDDVVNFSIPTNNLTHCLMALYERYGLNRNMFKIYINYLDGKE